MARRTRLFRSHSSERRKVSAPWRNAPRSAKLRRAIIASTREPRPCSPRRRSSRPVWLFSRLGRPLYEIQSTTCHATTNAAYGGPDGKTLYITESETGTILQARLETAGLRLYSHQ